MSALKSLSRIFKPCCAALALAACSAAWADPVLIVRSDIAVTDNPTAQAVANLSTLQAAAGNTVTVVTALPTSLAGYSQVWDLAFRGALSASSQGAYLGYLQQGGSLMLIGENEAIFSTRNNGIRDFIALAGGGAVGAQSAVGTVMQTLRAPYAAPDPVSSPFSLPAPAYFDNEGTGNWLLAAENDDLGSGLAFDAGDLANARTGTLLSVLDIDFLGDLNTPFMAQTRALAANLVSVMTNGPASQVPEPPMLALLGLALAFASLGSRGRNTPAARPAAPSC